MTYLFFSSPGKVVVNENGQISGVTNQAREVLHGKRFWKDQLREVVTELDWELGEPRRRAELDREFREMDREFDRTMEEMDQKYPDTRPSAAERHAEALRKRADDIEMAEMARFLEQIRLKRIAELRRIRSIVEAKAK